MTSITLPRRILRPADAPLPFRPAAAAFLATLAAGLALTVASAVALGATTGSTALPGVTVGGVSLAGMDRAAAEARLTSSLPSLSAASATLVVDGDEFVVPYADLGRGYEMAAMLDSAFAIGRSGNPIVDAVTRLRALANPTELPVIVHAYDPPALDAVVADVVQQARVEPRDALVLRSGTAFPVRGSTEGRVLQPATVHAALQAATSTSDPADVRINLAPVTVPPLVTTEAAAAAAEAARRTATAIELSIPGASEDEATVEIGAATIASWISFGPLADQSYAMVLDADAASSEIATLADVVDRDPVSARITVAGTNLGGVVPGQTGRELDVSGSTDALLAALAGRGGGAPVASMLLAVDITEPELTTEQAEAALPQMQMISSWTTHYTPNDGNGYGANINIPARDIDGRNLAPGEWFSFWGSIGPVTVERGYHYGGVIIGGRSVANGAIGGGICSTSTTIFNAALRAGLQMGERLNHYYYIDRYPDGLDATVYMADGWVQDMTFRNDTEHPLVIRGYGGNGFVTFQVWGVPTGRTVAISDAVTSNHRAAIETTQVDASLAPGASRRVEYPHHGHDVIRTRTVYDANGSVIHNDRYFSSYRPVNGITLVGPTPAAPAASETDDEAATVGAGDVPPDPPGDDPPDEDA